MTGLNILTITVAIGGLIFFVAVSFALTTGVLREYLFKNVVQTDGAKSVRLDTNTPSP